MIHFYPESPNEGVGCLTHIMNRYRQMRGACLTCMLNRYRQSRGARSRYRMTRKYPELPNKGACFRYMVNRNHQIRGVLQIYGSRYQMRGACLRYRMSRYRQLRGACSRYRMTRIHQVFRYMEYRNRQMRGPWFEIYDESKSAKEGAC